MNDALTKNPKIALYNLEQITQVDNEVIVTNDKSDKNLIKLNYLQLGKNNIMDRKMLSIKNPNSAK